MKPQHVNSLYHLQRPNNLESFSSMAINFKRRGIHCCNLNIGHLKPNIDDMKILLNSSNSIDVLGLCETFLNTSIDDRSIHVDGYKVERKDRYDSSSTTYESQEIESV